MVLAAYGTIQSMLARKRILARQRFVLHIAQCPSHIHLLQRAP